MAVSNRSEEAMSLPVFLLDETNLCWDEECEQVKIDWEASGW